MLLSFLLGVFLVRYTEGVSCYTCTYTSSGKNTDDKACVDAPMNVTQGGKVTMCPDSRFCTTYRQYDYAMNAVRSFARLCSERMGNKCQEDSVFRRQDCYTTCHEELCNSGDGVPDGFDKLPADGGGLGVGVDSGKDAGDGGGDDKHAQGPSRAGSSNMDVGVGGGHGDDNNDNNGNNEHSSSNNNNGNNGNNQNINNNNNNNGNNGDNGNNNGNDNGNNNNNNNNNNNGHSSGTDNDDTVSSVPDNSSASVNATGRRRRPVALPAWRDEWNYKERVSRTSGVDAVAASVSALTTSVLITSVFVWLRL